MSELADAREWHRVIRASVRECVQTWTLQAQAGTVTVEALETILARATVPILHQVEERKPELVVALLPSVVRTMLSAFAEGHPASRASPSRLPEPPWRTRKLPSHRATRSRSP